MPRQPETDARGADASAPCPLPETGYLRLHQIIGRPARKGRPAIPALIPVSRSTWWAGVPHSRSGTWAGASPPGGERTYWHWSSRWGRRTRRAEEGRVGKGG